MTIAAWPVLNAFVISSPFVVASTPVVPLAFFIQLSQSIVPCWEVYMGVIGEEFATKGEVIPNRIVEARVQRQTVLYRTRHHAARIRQQGVRVLRYFLD